MKRIFLLTLLCCGLLAGAQSTDTLPAPVAFTTGQYLKSYWDNGLDLVQRPLHWKGKDWTIFGASVGLTAGLTLVDDDINKPFKTWYDKGTGFGKAGSFIGSTPVMVGGTLLTLGIGAWIKDPKLKQFAMDNLQAQVFTGAFTYATKVMFGRARPFQGRGAHYWDGPFGPNGFESFFSGHTSLAFTTANMIYLHSRRQWWVALLSYGGATAIGISRMQYQRHWASDVLMGAVCGWAVSTFVYNKNKQKRKELAKWK